MNWLVLERDARVLLVPGPGHGATANLANLANLWLEDRWRKSILASRATVAGCSGWCPGLPGVQFPGADHYPLRDVSSTTRARLQGAGRDQHAVRPGDAQTICIASIDVIDRVRGLRKREAHLRQQMADERLRHGRYTRAPGEDAPEVREWRPSA